jgi:hypothetical protein
MPRGTHKDAATTKLLLDNGLLLDKRSFVGYDRTTATVHLYLRGIDKSNQRARVFRFHRETCSLCGRRAPEDPNGMIADGFRGEWHHKSRCDCVGCSEVRCGQLKNTCHRHRTRGFRQVAEVKGPEDFSPGPVA